MGVKTPSNTKSQLAYRPVKETQTESFEFNLIKNDPYLQRYAPFYRELRNRVDNTRRKLLKGSDSLLDFASAHEYFGLHLIKDAQSGKKKWIFREWAPNASKIYIIGTFSNWKADERYRLQAIGEGKWEALLDEELLHHQDHYRLLIEWPGGCGERIPAYARRVVQDEQTKIFSAQVWQPAKAYKWKKARLNKLSTPLLIYEAHIGMAQEKEGVGTYKEFTEKVLPRIAEAGYNTIQLMGILEHPYYGSFGYQVSNFFAPSSRFGPPEDLMNLIDQAHQAGIQVFLDLVHSHAVKNEVEGLSRFDGTTYQYFHDGGRGEHSLWDSRLFDYGKLEVLHFLLSNVHYWIDAFKFDGFRFDGVTSMIYYHHGIFASFPSYDCYFNGSVDLDALVYLTLANELAHQAAETLTIAEEVSGLPGLATSYQDGGIGFDYRLAMGVPDYWIKIIKEKKDEQWDVEEIFWRLVDRRADEKSIGYAESHDQALVGDKTIIFRLLDKMMYFNMRVDQRDVEVERGLALHCIIRLLSLSTAGHGYLNFMGNEFGHPEWIDFPRPGNNWSYKHARRIWSICDDPTLQYHYLADFDKCMLETIKKHEIFSDPIVYKHYSHIQDQVLVYSRKNLFFLYNLNPTQSWTDYEVCVPKGTYKLLLCTDDKGFGGTGRVAPKQKFYTQSSASKNGDCLKVYLPTRTALVLVKE